MGVGIDKSVSTLRVDPRYDSVMQVLHRLSPDNLHGIGELCV